MAEKNELTGCKAPVDRPVPSVPEQMIYTPLEIGEIHEWYYALPAPLDRLCGGKLKITGRLTTQGGFVRVYTAKAVEDSSDETLYVKFNPNIAEQSSEIKAIPYLLKEKGRFVVGDNEYLLFDGFDGSFQNVFTRQWFKDLSPDEKVSQLCSVVLRQLFSAMALYPINKFNFDFKPANVLYKILPDGRREIRLIDMTESIISGSVDIIPGIYLLPMATEHYMAPAFCYYFTRLAEGNTQVQPDSNPMNMAKGVLRLCDIYTLGLELYYFLSGGEKLIKNLPDDSFRNYYHEGEGTFSASAEKLILVNDGNERSEMAELINLMISWRENTQPHVFCEEVIRRMLEMLEKYGQLPRDVELPLEYLPRFDCMEGIDVVLKISNSITSREIDRNDFIEYQTFFLREGDVSEVNLSIYNVHPGRESCYREKLDDRVYLMASGNTVRCRTDGDWEALPAGAAINVNTSNACHRVSIERMV